MNDTIVTLQGWAGSDPVTREAGGSRVTSLRVGATPRRYSRRQERWVDGATQWFTVNAWRALGEHVAASIRRSDPVVVHGRLTEHTWTSEAGVPMTTLEVEAVFVGHDLNRGTSAFTKSAPAASAGPEADPGRSEETAA